MLSIPKMTEEITQWSYNASLIGMLRTMKKNEGRGTRSRSCHQASHHMIMMIIMMMMLSAYY